MIRKAKPADLDAVEEIYNEKTGYKLAVFHLEDATAFDYALISKGESLL